MTEAEWETCTDANAMLAAVRQKSGARKFRLLACACARTLRYALVEKVHRQAIDIAEQFADGLVDRDTLESTASHIEVLSYGNWPRPEGDRRANSAAEATVGKFAGHAATRAIAALDDASDIVREIMGNPFRIEGVPVGADIAVRGLALEIYTQRSFHKFAQLADLLTRNGCDDQRLMAHLRSHGPHYRGCWALDAVLGMGLVSAAEWQESMYPTAMRQWWEFYRGKPTARKERLLACASCRLANPLLTRENLHPTLAMAEAYADGLITAEVLAPIHEKVRTRCAELVNTLSNESNLENAQELVDVDDACRIAHAVAIASNPDDILFVDTLEHFEFSYCWGTDSEYAQQAALVRDILGSPFGEPVIAASWWTANVVALARGIYDERAFDRLPILADALQDAGCDDAAILEHCHSMGPHVRGCWVVDLLLGKS